ncbi:MAG: DUF2062 domain-containing protein [Pirellulaceae bacterium]|jgi:uncharacterized protein (DUF2062 family)|nr:DUF2062 domain-containing protein [Pirellulaceae bacterium]
MKIVSDQFRHYWKRAKDFCVYKVLHADDPPHRLALGIAVGMFVTFTPLIGFQMLLSVTLAWMLRANKLVGIPLVWISNPATAIPIYYPCYRLGCVLLGGKVDNEKWTEWQQLQADPTTTWGITIKFWWEGLMDIIPPLCLGCVVVASALGVLSYYISLLAIRSYRLRRWGQLMPPKLTPVEEVGRVPEQSRVSHPAASTKGNAPGEENAA